MKRPVSLNETILHNLITERELAIASGNKERLEEIKTALEIHLKMISEDVKKHELSN